MQQTKHPAQVSSRSINRRGFLKGAPAAALAATAITSTPSRAASGDIIAYVGAYTDKGKGIHMFYLNRADGTLTRWKELTGILSPSSLAFHPTNKYLYAVNEISNFNGTTTGSVTSIAVDQSTGDLRIMNVVTSGGGGPAHLSVDPTGKYVFAANYGGGSVGVLPIQADGTLGQPTDVKRIPGTNLGIQPAQSAPPGSFAISGHDAPHAHQAEMDPTGKFLLVNDLGTDRIYIYRFDAASGMLTLNDPGWVQAYSGNGPRHTAWSKNGRFLYSLNEESSTIDFMGWDGTKGELVILQSISALPDGYEGTSYGSEIHMSDDGRILWAANRLHNSIAVVAVDPVDGWMTLKNTVWTQGDYPRHFGIDPTGNYMYILHSRSDNVTAFRVDKATGNLTFTGKFYGVGNPSKIVFLTLA